MIAEMTIIIFVFAFLAGIFIYAWRDTIEWGHVVYIVCCAVLVICSFFFVAFRNPVDKSIHMGFRWSPPTYIDKSADLGMTEEIYRVLKKMPDVEVADDYVEKSQTKEMDYSSRINRRIRWVLFLCIAGGWFFVPELINQAIYSTVLENRKSKDPNQRGDHNIA